MRKGPRDLGGPRSCISDLLAWGADLLAGALHWARLWRHLPGPATIYKVATPVPEREKPLKRPKRQQAFLRPGPTP